MNTWVGVPAPLVMHSHARVCLPKPAQHNCSLTPSDKRPHSRAVASSHYFGENRVCGREACYRRAFSYIGLTNSRSQTRHPRRSMLFVVSPTRRPYYLIKRKICHLADDRSFPTIIVQQTTSSGNSRKGCWLGSSGVLSNLTHMII